MNRNLLIATGALGLGVGLLLGALFFGKPSPSGGSHVEPASTPSRTSLEDGGAEQEKEEVATHPFGIKSEVRTREEMVARIAELEAREAELTSKNQELEKRLATLEQTRKVDAARVKAELEELARGGLGVMARPGELAKVVSALKALGSVGVDMALELLNSDDPNARFVAAKILEDLNDPRAIPDLQRIALEDKEEMPRNMASRALAFMKTDEVLPALRDIYKKADAGSGPSVNALAGLAIHNDPQGLRDTVAFIRDGSRPQGLRQALAGILIMPLEHLMPVAEATASQFHDNRNFMNLLVSYYSQVGTPAARTRLERMADDASLPASVREAARNALNP